MMLRVAAAVSAVLGVTILLLYLGEVGKAPWSPPASRHLRLMKERAIAPAACEPTTFARMSALPRNAPLAVYGPIEGHGVTLEGYVQRMVRAPDGDIHLDFADTLEAEGHLVPYLSAEITPEWHLASPRWRFERLVALFRPYLGGATRWADPPARVRLSGWLMYDYPYEGEPPVFGFPPHQAWWEIHPVTRIETWNDAQRRYVEYAR